MNNDELIAAGHELAKCLDNEPLLDIAKMLSKMATQLDVTTAALREKTKQCEQLAAENEALKDFGDKLDRMHNDLNGEGTGIQGRAEVACQQIALEAALEEFDAIKTPATDAFLREVRAQGAEAAAAYIKLSIQQIPEDLRVAYHDAIELCSGAAYKLRQGGDA
ncbi:hypothetical protein AAAW60_001208 [Cronobacter sakazakii]